MASSKNSSSASSRQSKPARGEDKHVIVKTTIKQSRLDQLQRAADVKGLAPASIVRTALYAWLDDL